MTHVIILAPNSGPPGRTGDTGDLTPEAELIAEEIRQKAAEAEASATQASGFATEALDARDSSEAFATDSLSSSIATFTDRLAVSQFVLVATNAAERAESAVSMTAAFINPATTIADGLLKTNGSGTDNRFFSVPGPANSDILASLYRNDAGSATLLGVAPSLNAITALGFQLMSAEANGLSFALTDSNDMSSWIQADLLGLPTPYTAKCIGEKLKASDAPLLVAEIAEEALAGVGIENFDAQLNELSFSISDSTQTRSDIELDLNGQFSQRVIDSIRRRIGAVASVPPFPLNAWACWGDSLTAGGWPTTLSELAGVPVYNGGWGGQTAQQIAAREGGVPARLSVVGSTIPTTGPVLVSNILNNPLSDGGSRLGFLAEVEGTLAMTGGMVTFTRTANGVETICPDGSYFTPTEGETYANRHVTIWVGRNSFKTVASELIVASIDGMISYLTPRVKRVIVMSIPPWVGEENGTAVRNTLNSCNAAIAAAFPASWLDISAWLRTQEAATAAGIVFTADDLIDIANGLTPRSLRSDAGHLNELGNVAVGKRVYQESQRKGWM